MNLLVKIKQKFKSIIASNTCKYLMIIILNTMATVEMANIGICLINYNISVNREYLSSITSYALLLSINYVLILILFRKLRSNNGKDYNDCK